MSATQPRDRAIATTSEPRGTRAADSEATKANILAVARAEFADKGLSGARIDEIAERTNTSKRMIYYHFASKEGLYRAVLEEAYTRIRETETAMPIETMGAEEALKTNVRMTFDYHHEHPEFVRLVMNENMHHGEFIRDVAGIKRRNESVIRVLGEILAKGRDEGVFRADLDPIDLHMTISALCFYNVSNRYTFSEIFRRDMVSPDAVERRREQVVEVVLAACRPS
ncbi:TetR/AcrR family transcriptional regulator [Sphingomonas glacialis]|uniref:TetR/AcrR family transcriptional regulator n=1 Tax=Sphingomonas glacialis TaxID=658225 RepID=A0A502FY62_9SPHN|nr:TetR/AcrR family transcriptional regulator [Sphingomonas glacialis]TPG53873.1 TetR/AcrR family transcriptional regulator [Sphingomonas glacialis]